MKKSLIYRQDAFTLIEIVIALVIAAIGLLSVVGLQASAIKGNRYMTRLNTAIFFAEKKMEEFENTPFSSLTLVTNQGDSNNPLNSSEANGGIFNRSWTIRSYQGSANMKEVTVTVSWTEAGMTHWASFDTVIAK